MGKRSSLNVVDDFDGECWDMNVRVVGMVGKKVHGLNQNM